MKKYEKLILLGLFFFLFAKVAIAIPGDVLYQNYGNGTASNDFKQAAGAGPGFISYPGNNALRINTSGSCINCNSENVTTGVDWQGKVLNFTFTLADAGQSYGAGQYFEIGISNNSAAPNTPGSPAIEISTAISASNYTYYDGAGRVNIGARTNGNHTFTIYINTANTTSNVRIYLDGKLNLTTSTAMNTGIIKTVYFWHGTAIASNQDFYNITLCDTYCQSGISNMTISINDTLTGNLISGFNWNFTTNNTNDNTVKSGYCSVTSCSITNFTGVINISVYNVSGNNYLVGDSPKYTFVYNSTSNNYTFSAYKSLYNVSVYQLFTNSSISSFNVTSGSYTNSTPSNGYAIVPGNNVSSSLQIQVAGNYTKNITCTPTPMSTALCNATGIYDNVFTIGGNASGVSVSTFTVNVTNASLGGQLYSSSTTNGSIAFPLLQGYSYYFIINPPSYSINNATLPANASTNLYNFSILQQNSFEFHFFNETTDSQLNTANVSVQLISDLYSNNYSTTNGTLIVTLLTPGLYTITYWIDPIVPRNYYVTLTNQSYNNITLYVIDTGISSIYIPVINNEFTRPIPSATVSLLRAFIENNAYVYKTVEMAKTDTNGQTVLRVVPNYINYKLLLTSGSTSTTTAPTKFTANTNSYTLSFTQNTLTSIVGIPSVSKSITFNNLTNTYVFTWSDTSNLVTQGCMNVQKYNSSGITTVQNSCSSGSTGSIIYTITDTNNTRYSASATLSTNTQYSTYSFGPITADFTNTATQVFGLTGLILMSILLVTVGFMANESGTDSLIIITVIGMVLLGIVGIVAYSWESYIGIIILAVIFIYKTNG